MFTGIIECLGTVQSVTGGEGTNMDLWVSTPVTGELKIDQSVAHNGVCLTVVDISGDAYKVTAVAETLVKTNLSSLQPGSMVNIERAMKVGDRLDGHFVQGHVDTTGTCEEVQQLDGSWLYRFRFPKEHAALVIEKGSICINGVSLTAFDVTADTFTVTIIPYTYGHTTFQQLKKGDTVNLEFDVLGKYLLRSREVSRE
ncbi:MAG: riboflavin synthase [Chitinophagaceae bacterium]|nr:riboflavin synthase [Chitinophagaceae bacterium]